MVQNLYFHISHCTYLREFNVSLSFLFITNSSQIGLLCINLLGISRIQDSVITHSNYRLLKGKVDCSVDNWECCGSNLWVRFSNPLNKVASNFTVERTKISYGVNLITRPNTIVHFHLVQEL